MIDPGGDGVLQCDRGHQRPPPSQVSAVKAALDRVAVSLIDDHVRHCVTDAVRNGNGDAKAAELSDAIGRFLAG